METHYEEVKAVWEERFEKIYGRWRSFIDQAVWRYLDCGVPENGFARLKCCDCGRERLLSFSCKQRGLCPSCDAKRAAAFAAFLQDELLEKVGHSMWTFTIPKMLRPYFMHHRELLADLARLAYETIRELMAEAVGDPRARPGVVAVPQTFGGAVRPHPHSHCLASRGVWNEKGQWTPVPYIDTTAAEKLFRHKVIHFLKNKGLLSDERIEILNAFRRSGFSVDCSVTVWPQDTQGLLRVASYLLRCPVSLSRIHWTPGSKTLFYESNGSQEDPLHSHPQGETLDVFEFVARVLTQVPEPRIHNIHRFGIYSSKARACRAKKNLALSAFTNEGSSPEEIDPTISAQKRAALRKRWAHLIRRVYLKDPLICPDCGGELRVIAFITEPKIIAKILRHLRNRKATSRAPPSQQTEPVFAST
jgi:hypothetical protein